MNIKEKIKILIDVDVDTEDLTKLMEEPEKHTQNEEDAKKLKGLFILFESMKNLEEENAAI